MKMAHELANPADFKTISELAAFHEGARAGMVEALRFAVVEAATYDIEALTLTLRNKLEELEMKQ